MPINIDCFKDYEALFPEKTGEVLAKLEA